MGEVRGAEDSWGLAPLSGEQLEEEQEEEEADWEEEQEEEEAEDWEEQNEEMGVGGGRDSPQIK